jgi:pilus assembly protein CpaF
MSNNQGWNTLLAGQSLSADDRKAIIAQAAENLDDLSLEQVRDRERLREEAVSAVHAACSSLGRAVVDSLIPSLVDQVVAQVGGLSFFHELLPPIRDDLTEIMLNPNGSLWVIPKGERNAVQMDYLPSIEETWRAVEALLAPIGRSISKANPLVHAKLPRSDGMGGARVHIVHPRLAPGEGYPAINIRLFEPRPVTIEQLLAWEVAPVHLLDALIGWVGGQYRILVTGATATGKTTLLSAICNGIPKDARVLKIEEPEEIWIDHPHVVTLESYSTSADTGALEFDMEQLVDSSLRMSPWWLIVGEVRTGDVANTLFRAQMSDHPGLSTFHATDPRHAVHRMALIMFTDAGIRFAPAKGNFAEAIDLIVQIGWLDGRRQIVGVWAVRKALKGGDVAMEDVYLADGYRLKDDADRLAEIESIYEKASQSGEPVFLGKDGR